MGFISIVPTLRAHRYTQLHESRHFGMDAEIQRPGKANFRVLHCQNEARTRFKLPSMA